MTERSPLPPGRWSMMLPKDAPAVRTARQAVEEWLADGPAGLRDDARSVVTELVSNAVRYGEPPIWLTMQRQAGGVRIDVTDAGVQRPAYSRKPRSGGWGLRIVDGLSAAWNVGDHASRVWCVLESDPHD